MVYPHRPGLLLRARRDAPRKVDLGRLQEPESQIVLGAAVIDDIIGLVILTVVAGLTQGEQITALGVARITGVAFGFLL